jgi:ribose 1,5-bisphosphate isomerase
MSDQAFNTDLAAIQADRNSGAAELARRCLGIIAQSCLYDNSNSTSELLLKLDRQLNLLAQSRPSMAPVVNLLVIFQKDIEKFRQLSPADARKKCVDITRKIIEASKKATEKTAQNVATLIGEDKKVFTHSYSSTVIKAFTLLGKKGLKVIVSESRPLYEGYRLAEKLSQLEIPTTLITEAQTGLFVKDADLVLVGADTILADFSVVNKAGTYPAALSAHDNLIPFYVCGEKYKQIHGAGKTPELETMDTAEINGPDLPFVELKNVYFDITPARLIRAWINEDGMIPIQPINSISSSSV